MKVKPTLVCDTEVYGDYFLVMFRNIDTGNVVALEKYDGVELDVIKLRAILYANRIVTFNGINYDLVTISAAMAGKTNAQIKQASDLVIKTNLKPWIVAQKMGFKILERIDHIDVIEVAPGRASLKLYAGRAHAIKLQDLPYDPDSVVGEAEREQLRLYCENDLQLTEGLYRSLIPQIELRNKMTAEYGEDLRSKSDAQIAEAVIKGQLGKETGVKPSRPEIPEGTKFKYKPPKFIFFATHNLREAFVDICDADFSVASGGKVNSPKGFEGRIVEVGAAKYRMGQGGLHSCESKQTFEADDDFIILDRDVASYYPAIILNCNLFPKHLGEQFLKVYRKIVDQRLKAKHDGDKVTADSLKITINGSFGKFGSMWSALYSPNLLIQTTVTGQLALLMLIEQFEMCGARVISANTDGIVIYVHKELLHHVEDCIAWWEIITGFETEETRYRGLYSRDVNNYIAIKADKGFKTKGVFVPPNLAKNPANEICAEAVIAFLMHNTPVEETVVQCGDIRKFLTVRTVNGGALFNDKYLGKVVRWYYRAGSTDKITYKLNGKLVASSTGAAPLMELPDALPTDVDYAKYIGMAYDYLTDVGYTKEIKSCL